MTTPQEDAELRDQLSDLRKMIYTITPDSVDDAKLDKIVQWVSEIILDRDEQREREMRRVAKMENARDFSAVVKAFNEALSAGFDAPSVRSLRMVINGADARANYIDLPEQITNPQQQDKEEE